jgi:hypothetical protein
VIAGRCSYLPSGSTWSFRFMTPDALAVNRQRKVATNSRTNVAISSAAVSKAK